MRYSLGPYLPGAWFLSHKLRVYQLISESICFSQRLGELSEPEQTGEARTGSYRLVRLGKRRALDSIGNNPS